MARISHLGMGGNATGLEGVATSADMTVGAGFAGALGPAAIGGAGLWGASTAMEQGSEVARGTNSAAWTDSGVDRVGWEYESMPGWA